METKTGKWDSCCVRHNQFIVMAIQLTQRDSGKWIEVDVSERLHKSDYERFVPEFERLVKENGRLRVLFVMEDFHGWDPAALWEDLKFDLRHFADIDRVAMVGDKTWEEAMATFCQPFTKAKVSYFGRHRLAEAHEWLAAD